MRRLKKFALGITLLGSTIVLPACSSLALRDVRDAALAGTSSFVEDTVLSILNGLSGSAGATQ